MMKSPFATTCLSLALVSAIHASPARAQDAFPAAESHPASCDSFQWNAEMLREHPRIVDACQEVVSTPSGQPWARLSAHFVMVHSDGRIVFEVVDARDRQIGQVALAPRPGQTVTLDGREVAFERLRSSDRINLYSPENIYGFAAGPGAAAEEMIAASPVEFVAPPPAPVVAPPEPMLVAAQAPPPRLLPATSSVFPSLLMAGLMLMVSGFAYGLRRKI